MLLLRTTQDIGFGNYIKQLLLLFRKSSFYMKYNAQGTFLLSSIIPTLAM